MRTNTIVTTAIPANMAAKVMDTNRAGQWSGHDRHLELPSDRLRSGGQEPHSNPVRLKAHCASGPLDWLRFINSFFAMSTQLVERAVRKD